MAMTIVLEAVGVQVDQAPDGNKLLKLVDPVSKITVLVPMSQQAAETTASGLLGRKVVVAPPNGGGPMPMPPLGGR